MSDATRDSVDNVDWFGVPMFDAFRDGDRHGVHLRWGTPAILLGLPVLASILVGALARARMRRRRTSARGG